MAVVAARLALVGLVSTVMTSACGRGGGGTAPVATPAASARSAEDKRPEDWGPVVNSSARPHAIPAAMLGKWGMGLADCDPSRGDDKGVMIVSHDSLKFFEAHAQLAAVVSASDDHIRAAFAFAGEGQNWTREEDLSLQSDGKSLIRRESGGDLPPVMKYIRCPS